jgi:sec-independent protein translocase protein TatC
MKFPFKSAERPVLKGPEDRMTLRDHLAELRVRIVRSMLAITLGVVIMLAFYDPVLRFLLKPYRSLCLRRPSLGCDGKLYGLGPLDGFSTRISVSLYGGLIIAFPVVLWQIWRFIVPGLHAKEKKYAVPFIISTIALFALGGYIAYWTLDKALEFLISWSGAGVGQVFQVSKYISLVGLMVFAFGIGFEFPLVFLQLVGVLTPQALTKGWRYAIMAIFVIAAVITPSGDPISMLALAVPMSVFYLCSIVIGLIIQRRKRSRADADDDDDNDDATTTATASA